MVSPEAQRAPPPRGLAAEENIEIVQLNVFTFIFIEEFDVQENEKRYPVFVFMLIFCRTRSAGKVKLGGVPFRNRRRTPCLRAPSRARPLIRFRRRCATDPKTAQNGTLPPVQGFRCHTYVSKVLLTS